jgi:hypothetical protein
MTRSSIKTTLSNPKSSMTFVSEWIPTLAGDARYLKLRVSAAGELAGLDLHEHGMVAYPEYVIHGFEPGLQAIPGTSSQAFMPKAQAEAVPGEA